ncbi:hypothetical protein REPUB_Repub08aG0213000 [Reevesia pubescens]
MEDLLTQAVAQQGGSVLVKAVPIQVLLQSEADAYDHSSYYRSKRQHSTLENTPPSYANSRHRGSRAHSSYKIYESDSQYSDVYGNDYQYVDC